MDSRIRLLLSAVLLANFLAGSRSAAAQTHFPGGFDKLDAAPGRPAVDERRRWVIQTDRIRGGASEPIRFEHPVHFESLGHQLWLEVTRQSEGQEDAWPYRLGMPLDLPIKLAPFHARTRRVDVGAGEYLSDDPKSAVALDPLRSGWPNPWVGRLDEQGKRWVLEPGMTRQDTVADYRLFFDSQVRAGSMGNSLHLRWGTMYAGFRALSDLLQSNWTPADPNAALNEADAREEAKLSLLDLGIEPLVRSDFPERGKLNRVYHSYRYGEASWLPAAVADTVKRHGTPSYPQVRALIEQSLRRIEAGTLGRADPGFLSPFEAHEVLTQLEIGARLDAIRFKASHDEAGPGVWQLAGIPEEYYAAVTVSEPLVRYLANWEGEVDGRKRSDSRMDGEQFDIERQSIAMRVLARTADYFRITPEQSYQVSGMARYRHCAYGRARVVLEVYAAESSGFAGPRLIQELGSEEFYGDSTEQFAQSGGWQEFRFEVRELHPAATYYRLRCEVRDLRRHGEVWFDSLKVEEAKVSHFFEDFNGATTPQGLPERWRLDEQDPARNFLHHALLRLDEQVREGDSGRSLQVLTKGFNVRYQVAQPRLRPINPAKTYTFDGLIRTSGLKRQRAYLEMQLFDADRRPVRPDGRPAKGEEHLLRAEGVRDGDSDRVLPFGVSLPGWKHVERRVEGLDDRVRYMGLALVIEGPPDQGDHQGQVWFENLLLRDEPSVTLTFLEPTEDGTQPLRDETNVLPLSQGGELGLRIRVRGLERNRAGFTYRLDLEDVEGRVIFHYDSRTDFTGPYLVARTDEAGTFVDEVTLPSRLRRRGFYRLRFHLALGERQFTGEGGKVIKFAFVEGYTLGRRESELGLGLRWRGEDGDTLLDETFRNLEVDTIKLAVWPDDSAADSPQGRDQAARQSRFLAGAHVRSVIASFGESLRGASPARRPEGLYPLISDPAADGLAQVEQGVGALAAEISQFQLGADLDPSFSDHDDLGPGLERALGRIRGILPSADLWVPISLQRLARRAKPGGAWPALPTGVQYALSIGADMSAAQVEAAFLKAPTPRPFPGHAVIEAMPLREDDPRDQALDFARKVVLCKAQGIDRLFLRHTRGPSGVVDENDRIQPLFVAFKVLNGLLSGYRLESRAPRMKSGDALATFLFSRSGNGAGKEYLVVVWPRSSEVVVEELYVGRQAEWVDLDGNRERIPVDPNTPGRVEFLPDPRHGLRFITNIDGPLLATFLDMGFHTQALQSRRSRQEAVFTLTNHFPEELKGAITVRFPDDWMPDAPSGVTRFPVLLSPGATFTRALPVQLTLSQFLGDQGLPVEADLSAGRHYRILKDARARVEAPLGLPSVVPVGAALVSEGAGAPRVTRFLLKNPGQTPLRLRSTFSLPPRHVSPTKLPSLDAGAESFVEFPVPPEPGVDLHRRVAILALRQDGGDLFVNARYRFRYEPLRDELFLELLDDKAPTR